MDFKGKIAALYEFTQGASERRLITYASSGAYYMFMSLVPIIMLICAIVPYTPLSQEVVLGVVREYLLGSVAEIVERIVDSIYSRGSAAITVSLILTVWSASASLRALIRGMDAAYDEPRRPGLLVLWFRSCFYMVILVAVLFLSLIVLVYGGRLLDILEEFLTGIHALGFLLYLARYLRFGVVMILLAIVFTALYAWMPARRRRCREQIPGAIFTAAVWVLFSSGFSYYVAHSDRFGAYGFIGTVMVAMMWIFFCLYFLLVGAYLNSYLYTRRERRV